MERVYTSDGPVNGQIILEKDEFHHLIRVRRCQTGESVEAFNGQGLAWQCRILAASRDSVILDVIEASGSSQNPTTEFILATAVPKGERFDWLIEKATELGVSRMIPIACGRSVVEPRDAKIERLRKHVIEACKQCGRNNLMHINQLVKLGNLQSLLPANAVTFWAHRGGIPASKAWANLKPSINPVVVCIGPEGGWTADEQTWFESNNWQRIELGQHILRIETAGIAAASAAFQALVAE